MLKFCSFHIFLAFCCYVPMVVEMTEVPSPFCHQMSRYVQCSGPPLQFFPNKVNLTDLLLDNCQFEQLPKETFANVVDVTSIVIRCDKPITFEEGWLEPLAKTSLVTLDIAKNNLTKLPPNSFCSLTSLTKLNVIYNAIENPEVLGFTENDCQIKFQLKQLELYSNKIRVLSKGVFAQLPYLDYVQMPSNLIETIDPFAFKNLHELRYLNLARNQLSTIANTTFYTIPQLASLDLSNNKLDDDIFMAIAPLANLSVFYVSYNNIENLNCDILHRFPLMASMMFNNNRIKVIPSLCFSIMAQLALIDLSDNQLTMITDDSFVGLSYIVNLWLSNNSIFSVSDHAFTNLTTLRVLRLDRNHIQKMPIVTGLTVLYTMNVSYNRIEKLGDDDLVDQTNMYELDISNNQLKHMSQLYLRNVLNLMLLDLSANQIETIGRRSINSSFILRSVRLDQNKLKTISGIFGPEVPLQMLNLSCNQIEAFSYFDLPIGLEELYMNRNSIQSIEANRMPPQYQLRLIDLSYNRLTVLKPLQIPNSMNIMLLDNNSITHINERTFSYVKQYLLISLRNNLLTTLCVDWLPPMWFNLERPLLYISGNPFKCNCELDWVLSDITGKTKSKYPMIVDLEKATCTGEEITTQKLVTSTLRNSYNDNRFLCKTGVGGAANGDTCSCLDKRVQDNAKSICLLNCPTNCTCYRNGDWTHVVTSCADAGLSTLPLNLSVQSTYLLIKNNYIPTIFTNSFLNYSTLEFIDLGNNSVYFIEDFAFKNLNSVHTLNLDNNQLRKLTKNTFTGLASLQVLILNDNLLETIDEGSFGQLGHLNFLNLKGNKLFLFKAWELTVSSAKFLLGQNSWSCECGFVDQFRKWLQLTGNNSVVLDAANVSCLMKEEEDDVEIPMISNNDTACLQMDNKTKFVWLATVLGTTLGLMVPFIFLTLLVIYYRKEIQVLIYARYRIRWPWHEVGNADKQYDVFVSYSSQDDQFLVDNILPGLEINVHTPYRLCLHQRNFAPGAFISDAILEAVSQSSATLLLLSDNFLNSDWCRLEFQAAHLQMLKNPDYKVIVVLTQLKLPPVLHPEIKWYLKTHTYLCWGDKLFWKRLYFALPAPNGTFQDDTSLQKFI